MHRPTPQTGQIIVSWCRPVVIGMLTLAVIACGNNKLRVATRGATSTLLSNNPNAGANAPNGTPGPVQLLDATATKTPTRDAKPVLQWTGADGVLTYEITVCRDNPCTTPLQVLETPGVTQVAVPDLQEGDYFLDITGYGQGKTILAKLPTLQPLSVDRTPPGDFALSIPELHTQVSTPEVSWSEASEAATYELTLATSETCANPSLSYADLTTLAQTLDPLEEGRYAVCVTAIDAAGNQKRAETGILVVDITPPAAFDVIGPSPLGKDATPDVVWSESPDAASYSVVIASTPKCQKPLQAISDLTTTQTTIEPLANGSYYACVTATDLAENTTAAAPYQFTIAVEPPGTFTVTVPPASKTAPTVTWSASSAAVRYKVDISSTTSCSNAIQSYPDLTTQSQALSALSDGTYYACVTAYDIDDNHRLVVSKAFAIDNVPPVIKLGQHRWTGNSFTLRPSVTDSTPTTYAWQKASGPGSVSFGTATSLDTLVNMTSEGEYTVRLTATDQAGNSATGEATITWDRSRLLSLGRTDTCAIAAGGKLYCWGRNPGGQSGHSDGLMRSSPTLIDFGAKRSVLQVAAGGEFTCALLDDGSVRCWGVNTYGALGYGDVNPRSTVPNTGIALGTGRTALQIAAGYAHACAILDDGQIKCWGYNAYGQIGDGTTTDQWAPPSNPIAIGNGLTARMLALGEHFSCALLNDYSVKCWGFNNSSQLGVGAGNTSNRWLPTTVVFPGGTSAKKLATGNRHACAVMNDDTVRCWGLGSSAQLGDGSLSNSGTPVVVQGVTAIPTQVAASANATCIRFIDGTVGCLGGSAPGLGSDRTSFATDCSDGYSSTSTLECIARGGEISTQFRDCTNGASTGPGACADQGGFWAHCSDFASATEQACTGTWDATKYAYCTNSTGTVNASTFCSSLGGSMVNEGYCSDASYLSRASCLAAGKSWHIRRLPGPSIDFGGNNAVLAIASAPMGTWSCAVLSNANLSLSCWGDNTYGQLGYGKSQRERVFYPIELGGGVQKVVTASASTCALISGGSVKCWGSNATGRLGTGDYDNTASPPANALALATTATDLSAWSDSACALLSNGSIQCWGNNTYGRLGKGDLIETPTPTSVKNLGGSASHLGVGGDLTCAIVSGDVKCWGNISRLGVGSTNAATACSNGISTTAGSCTASNGTWSPTLYNDCSNGMSSSATVCASFANGVWAHCSDGTTTSSASCTAQGKTWNSANYAYCTHSNGVTSAGSFCTDSGGSFGRYGYCSNPSYTNRAACITANAKWHVSTLPGAKVNLGATATQVAVSANGACALIAGGNVRCWGDNTYGQVGVGATTTTNYTSAGSIIDFGGHAVTKIVASTQSYCALLDDSSVRCWGRNNNGNLATGDTVNLSQPKAESADFGSDRSVVGLGASSSGSELCVITDDNAVICPGSFSPPFVSGDALTTPLSLGTTSVPTAVSSGSALCVIFADQSLRCSGENSEGQAGFGSSSYNRPPPGEAVLRLAL